LVITSTVFKFARQYREWFLKPLSLQGGKKFYTSQNSQNIDSAGNLKNAGQLIEVYEGAGVLKYAEIVCYSDSFEDSAITYYALRALGYPEVGVYLPQKGTI